MYLLTKLYCAVTKIKINNDPMTSKGRQLGKEKVRGREYMAIGRADTRLLFRLSFPGINPTEHNVYNGTFIFINMDRIAMLPYSHMNDETEVTSTGLGHGSSVSFCQDV